MLLPFPACVGGTKQAPFQCHRGGKLKPVFKLDKPDPRTGQRVQGWIAYTIDVVRQTETRRHIFEITQADRSVIRREFTTTRRYFHQAELDAMFVSAGYVIEDVFTGYQKQKPESKSGQLMYVLKHA